MNGLEEALGEFGLMPRGGFSIAEDEAAPSGPSGGPTRSVLLVGHGGGTIWPHFTAWLKAQEHDPDDPLDAWSRDVINGIAVRFGARAVYPFDKPWLPFQQWAMRAEGLKPSPLGILMHPRFGLWHAYRGALLFDVDISIQAPGNPIHLCDVCGGKDCMNSCPAGAVSGADFDAEACAGWLRSDDGKPCRFGGCVARAACPHGDFRYGAEQAAFHMAARMRGLKEA